MDGKDFWRNPWVIGIGSSLIATIIVVAIRSSFSSEQNNNDETKNASNSPKVASPPQPNYLNPQAPKIKDPMDHLRAHTSSGRFFSWVATKPINHVFSSPDGKIAITTHSDGMIVWDVDKKEEKTRLGKHRFAPNNFVQFIIAPNNRYGASWSSYCVMVWDLTSGKEMFCSDYMKPTFSKYEGVAFNADGTKLLIVGPGDKSRHRAISVYAVRDWSRPERRLSLFTGTSGEFDIRTGFGSPCMRFSSNGRRLLLQGSGRLGQHFRLFEFLTWHEWDHFKVKPGSNSRGSPNFAAIATDGHMALTSSYEVFLWDLESGKIICETNYDVTFRKRFNRMPSIAAIGFLPAGQPVVLHRSGSVDTTLSLWDVKTDKQLARLALVAGKYNEMVECRANPSFAPNAMRVIFVPRSSHLKNDDRTLVVWDIPGLQKTKAQAHPALVEFAKNCPTPGEWSLTGMDQNGVEWKAILAIASCGKNRFKGFINWAGPNESNAIEVFKGTFDPATSKLVLKGQEFKELQGPHSIWQAKNTLIRKSSLVYTAKTSDDGRSLTDGKWLGAYAVVGHWKANWEGVGIPNLRETKTNGEIQSLRTPDWHFGAIAFSPDGGRILCTGANTGRTLHLLNAQTLNEIRQCRYDGNHTRRIDAIHFLPDGWRAVSISASARSFCVWALKTGKVMRETTTGYARRMTVSADGRRILVSGFRAMELWDVATAELLHRQKIPEGVSVGCIALSPDGTRAVIDISARLPRDMGYLSNLQMPNFAVLRVLPKKSRTRSAKSIAITPDNRSAIITFDNRTLELWNLTTGQKAWAAKSTYGPSSLFVSPDGRRVLDNSMRLWDVSTGKKLSDYQNGGTVALSADGQIAVSGSNRVLRLWRIGISEKLQFKRFLALKFPDS